MLNITKKELTTTYGLMRNSIYPWKVKSKQTGNNKCLLTGSKIDVEVHHLNKSFVDICDETFKELGIEYHTYTSEYDKETLDKIASKCLELHFRYGLGVLITKRLHIRFHDVYGVTGYTSEDFKTFKRAFRKKQFESRRHMKCS